VETEEGNKNASKKDPPTQKKIKTASMEGLRTGVMKMNEKKNGTVT